MEQQAAESAPWKPALLGVAWPISAKAGAGGRAVMWAQQ